MRVHIEFIEPKPWYHPLPNPAIFIPAVILALLVITLLFLNIARADTYRRPLNPPKDFYKAVLREAASEGYTGMYAVTHVYRNRLAAGLPLGCTGLKRRNLNKFVRQQPAHTVRLAKAIVNKVFYTSAADPTRGATHYENIQAYGKPYWIKDMTPTTKIGSHTFYKSREDK